MKLENKRQQIKKETRKRFDKYTRILTIILISFIFFCFIILIANFIVNILIVISIGGL